MICFTTCLRCILVLSASVASSHEFMGSTVAIAGCCKAVVRSPELLFLGARSARGSAGRLRGRWHLAAAAARQRTRCLPGSSFYNPCCGAQHTLYNVWVTIPELCHTSVLSTVCAPCGLPACRSGLITSDDELRAEPDMAPPVIQQAASTRRRSPSSRRCPACPG